MTRAVAVIALFVFASTIAACDQQQPKTKVAGENITLFTFENLSNAPFTAEYKEKYGVEPKSLIYADEDEAFAKMRAGYKPDVMGPCSYEFQRWQEAGLIRPIDVTKLKHWKDIPAALKNIPGMMKSETEAWFVPQYWSNTSITYRTDLAPEYVGRESWEILFDPKYKGRIAALDGVDDTVALIAAAMGIDPYNMSGEDWTKLQERLRQFVDNARFISSDETSLAQALASGEVVAAITWNQTYLGLKKAGKPVAFMKPPGGMFTYVCGFVMHADTKDPERALALIDAGLAPGAMKYQLEQYGDAPANTSIFANYSDAELAGYGFPRDVESFLKSGHFQLRLKNKDEIVKFWSEARSGG